jgi:hypothetical protein
MIEEKLLTVDDMAERLQVSPDWILDQVKFWGMPCIKRNARFFRFHWPTVLAWLMTQ